MTEDKIEVEILPDGTIKVTTDPISQPNHVGADRLLALFGELAGGAVTITKRAKHGHTHAATKTHTHG